MHKLGAQSPGLLLSMKRDGISSHLAYLSSDLAPKLDVLFKYFKLHRKDTALGNVCEALRNKAEKGTSCSQKCKLQRRGEGQV